ncbi:MAG: hypothetical protein NT163_05205 [Chlorobiales bacterium]|nr:hypothetical protein [Chlorobiales bacterium]
MIMLLIFSGILIFILWSFKGVFSEGWAGTALSVVLSLLCAVFGEPLKVWALGIDKKIFGTSSSLVNRSRSALFPAPELSIYFTLLFLFCSNMQDGLSMNVSDMVANGQIIFPKADSSDILRKTQLGTVTMSTMLPSLLFYGFILPLTKRTMLAREVFAAIFFGVVLALLTLYILGQWYGNSTVLLFLAAIIVLALCFSVIVIVGQFLGRMYYKLKDINDDSASVTSECYVTDGEVTELIPADNEG